MKRFLLFVCERYYPYGGWGDFQLSRDSENDIREEIKRIASEGDRSLSSQGYFQIVDTLNPDQFKDIPWENLYGKCVEMGPEEDKALENCRYSNL